MKQVGVNIVPARHLGNARLGANDLTREGGPVGGAHRTRTLDGQQAPDPALGGWRSRKTGRRITTTIKDVAVLIIQIFRVAWQNEANWGMGASIASVIGSSGITDGDAPERSVMTSAPAVTL